MSTELKINSGVIVERNVAGYSIELTGTARTIVSDAGNLSIGTLTSGDIAINSIEDLYIDADTPGNAVNIGTAKHTQLISIGAAEPGTCVMMYAGTGTGIYIDSLDILSLRGADVDSELMITGANLTISTVTSGELQFSDSYNAGSSWTQTYVPLSQAIDEWDDFETNFGEVSLFNALNQLAVGGGGGTLQDAYEGGNTIAATAGFGAVAFSVSDQQNIAVLTLTQSDSSNNPDALIISNAGTGASISLQGAGSRLITSDSADLTISTTTSGELQFSDSYNNTSSWTQTYVPLSQAIDEWDDFETNFGEVSLFNALNQLAAAVPTVSLQDAYDGGNSITIPSGGSAVTITEDGTDYGGVMLDVVFNSSSDHPIGIGISSPGGRTWIPFEVYDTSTPATKYFQIDPDGAIGVGCPVEQYYAITCVPQQDAIYARVLLAQLDATINSGDNLAAIEFGGSEDAGVTFTVGAEIRTSAAEAWWSAGYESGTNLSIKTCAIGASTTTERVRVSSEGLMILGVGEGGTTVATGNTFRAPSITTGGAGNIAGADLTIESGLGTGTGDPGAIIFNTTLAAAAGDNIHTASANTLVLKSGSVGMNTSTLTGYGLRNSWNPTGGTTAIATCADGTIQSGVTTLAKGFSTAISTAASAFTCVTLRHFSAEQGTIGATSAITNQIGYLADSTLTGATNNYGFYGNIAADADRYNLYMAGTALNYLNGHLHSTKTIYYTLYDNGNSGANKTIDWNNGQKQLLTLTADCTIAFTNPGGASSFMLTVLEDGTGGWSITWPAATLFPDGIKPLHCEDVSAKNLYAVYFDGTSYWVRLDTYDAATV